MPRPVEAKPCTLGLTLDREFQEPRVQGIAFLVSLSFTLPSPFTFLSYGRSLLGLKVKEAKQWAPVRKGIVKGQHVLHEIKELWTG